MEEIRKKAQRLLTDAMSISDPEEAKTCAIIGIGHGLLAIEEDLFQLVILLTAIGGQAMTAAEGPLADLEEDDQDQRERFRHL